MTEENKAPEKTPDPVGYPHGHAFPSGEGGEKIARLVADLGVGWARYGLTLGKLALHQSARALETTGAILGELAEKMEKVAQKKEHEPNDPPKQA